MAYDTFLRGERFKTIFNKDIEETVLSQQWHGKKLQPQAKAHKDL